MRASPIQLLESFPEKVLVEAALLDQDEEQGQQAFEKVDLQIMRGIEPCSDFWKIDPPVSGVNDRTFRVTLGVKTPENKPAGGYSFEFVVSGIVACLPERVGDKAPIDVAFEYGLTILYGMIREQFSFLSARMQPGIRFLPTVSFMGEMAAKPLPAPDSSE
ncbi:hypothetical protein ACFQNJ_06780 [Hydrogenophaga bisanensis]|uniref:Preprotein translocase subunit SecB n=1 Tax=Hydrogenophaga bisanensis TaxID=439611 RepID=A0ABW2R7Z8_9BURK